MLARSISHFLNAFVSVYSAKQYIVQLKKKVAQKEKKNFQFSPSLWINRPDNIPLWYNFLAFPITALEVTLSKCLYNRYLVVLNKGINTSFYVLSNSFHVLSGGEKHALLNAGYWAITANCLQKIGTCSLFFLRYSICPVSDWRVLW